MYTKQHMPQKDRSVDWMTLKHFWKLSAKYQADFSLSWLTLVSSLCLTIVVPYLIGKILGSLAQSGVEITAYLYVLIAAGIIAVIANRVSFSALFRLQPKVMADMHYETLTALLSRGSSYHNNKIAGKLVSDASDYPTSFGQISNVFFVELLPFALTIILGIFLVARESWVIGSVILVMTVVTIWSNVRFRNRMTPFRIKRHAAGKKVIAHLGDTIVNIQTVKSFGHESEELKRHGILSAALKKARMHDWEMLAVDGSYRVLGLLFFQVVFIVIVAQQIRSNPALLSTGIFAFSYTMTLSNRLFQIGIMLRQLEESLLLAMPMTEMLQELPEIADKPGAADMQVTQGDVSFEAVSFGYSDNPRNDSIFDSLNITIKAGEKVGLVGPSGGGKTTLTKLLLRFEDIQEGRICIDGQDITDVTQSSLRRSISYVPQEPLLFHRSIKENIAYGDSTATEQKIAEAARQAHADDFIARLPDGYDTVVGERGIKLSGGQRQRIAIARAILKDAPILVLDEATSALDSESEVAIQAALWKLMEGRTAIVVAHRLSTIQKMDRIIVLDGGTISELGSHDELLKKDGLYARLWNHQSGGFIDE